MWKRGVALWTIVVFAHACGPTVITPHLHDATRPPSPGPATETLKVHLRSGEMIVLGSWRLAEGGRKIEGSGTRYTVQRKPMESGPFSLAVEDVALLETEDRRTVSNLATASLGGLTLVFGALSGICLADPKSCFGSCPTFYVEEDLERPRAEGFSSSIARVLEARDVDSLPSVHPRGGRLAIWMRNEALETHAVRRVRLVSVHGPKGAQVFATRDGSFLPVSSLAPAATCRGPEGDCLEAVARSDGQERLSAADSRDLAAREELELSFPRAPARGGIVIRARQGLLTTFLFYQTLAYMGRSAGDWLAALERGGPERAQALLGMGRLLGGIEVAVSEAEGAWRIVGSFDEPGPISGDTQVIPLPLRPHGGPLRVRLRMAKGHWRVDQVALGELGAPERARIFEPAAVERDGRLDDEALRTLRSGGSHLVTLPGDAYRLSFSLPADAERDDLFLESEGYYYEWMRAEWMREEDPAMVELILGRPDEALRRLAPRYKDQEARAEKTFWSSRFGR
jgi:hypothetical protein